ncbi:MAG: aminotransferase class I/II-fold pyridoxal phosphate-dependent enzyme [Proteobacteria bacterium]|jgi:DNA-binding transcriptional MocR family regulator|nr:aminotransferase class I/II-fold pyridoxal phosphate-dependent enzyme [Pseudomonadota bacterium]MDA1300068.1 aminotransferase class I/II-fold pyridoxal phosphate-dependent enzyme [Pseudomonadota bacterium]
MPKDVSKDSGQTSVLRAPALSPQPVSVTRKMAASLPGLRKLATEKGLKIHHLGAGYPHPEVTDPRAFLAHKARYFEHLTSTSGINNPDDIPEYLRESYAYTDTLGPVSVRENFARVYGGDWNVSIRPDFLLPTVGASGGISLLCSLFERPGVPLAYITDAPTYAGFIARAQLASQARIYSVEMDEEGPVVANLRQQIEAARADGRLVPFYYSVPDGHNPAGFSFSDRRRREILAVLRELGVLIVEDAPYVYISYASEKERPRPFLSLDPAMTVHLFTGSKIGFPGPRVGFLYSEATVSIQGDRQVPLRDLLLTESSADILFHNPEALYGFEALLHDEDMKLRESLWPVAEGKLVVYRENRGIILDGLDRGLGALSAHFTWTVPQAGFFTVFRFLDEGITTDDAFVQRLVADHGIVVIPMYDFYPRDARERNPRAGLDELRLSFCFTESQGEARRRDLAESVAAFCKAVRSLTGL